MKTGKKLLLTAFIALGIAGCEKEDDGVGEVLTPQADFSISPAAPIEGDQVVFTAQPETGSSEIVSYDWNFGDPANTTATGPEGSFVYEDQGSYKVSLTVADAAGNVHKIRKTVEVAKKEFPAAVVWEFSNGTPVARLNEGSNAPAIADDGTIFYVEGNAGADSKIVAVRDNGDAAELLWATAIGHQLSNAPSIAPDGNVYILSWMGERGISKLDAASGEILWSGNTVTGVSNNTAAIDSEGNTYHGTRSNALGGAFSWTADGEKRWEIIDQGAFYAAPAISSDEKTVYFVNTNDNAVWAVNAADGTMKWEAPVGEGSGTTGTSVSLGADGTIYYTSNTHVVAVTDNGETGTVKWATEVSGAANSGIVIGPDGDLYTGSEEGLVSLNPADGTINWKVDEGEIAESVPAVDINGNVYVGTKEGNLLIVDNEGQIEKIMELGDNVVNSPTIASDGTVYIEVYDGDVIKLVKISVEDSAPADSAWPMKGQNQKNLGRAQ